MTSLQITYFLKAAEYMSFSRAAEDLYVSQPSVSRQIRQLEEELGYLLFDRSHKHHISLTAAGMVFRDSFRRSALSYQQARAAAAAVSRHMPPRLRIGISQCWDLTEALIRFRSQIQMHYPSVALHYENNSSLQLRKRLESEELDVIFCIKTAVQNFDHLEVLDITSLETRAYVRRGLLRQEDEPLQLSDFSGHTLLMLPEEEAPMSLQIVLLQFQARQIKVNPLRMPNRESIFQGLLLGTGFTVCTGNMWGCDDPRLTYCAMEEPIPTCVVWDKRNPNPLIRLFVEAMLREFGDQAAQSGPEQDIWSLPHQS